MKGHGKTRKDLAVADARIHYKYMYMYICIYIYVVLADARTLTYRTHMQARERKKRSEHALNDATLLLLARAIFCECTVL